VRPGLSLTIVALWHLVSAPAVIGAGTTLVSINAAGTASGNNFSAFTALSPDGRLVVFESAASDLVAIPKGNATACDGGPCRDVFVRDLQNARTTLVSVNSNATASGNDNSVFAALTVNGRFVVFNSAASNLVPTPKGSATTCSTPPCWDVFVRDLKLGTTTLVSINRTGTASGNDGSYFVSASRNGRFVAFGSAASDLVAIPKANTTACRGNPCSDIFVRDLKLGTTTLVSANASGSASGNAASFGIAFSRNWRYGVFDSSATDLGPTDTNGNPDVFVRDLKNATTTLVSANRAGADSDDGGGMTRAVSPNGRFVIFDSFGMNLVTQTNYANRTNLYVRDVKSARTRMISVNDTGTASADADAFFVASSRNRRFVVFESTASDLVATDTNNDWDIFRADLRKGITELVSVNSDGTDSGNGESHASQVSSAALSRSGRFVAFDSTSSNLVAIDDPSGRNGYEKVYLRDMDRRVTTLVSISSTGTEYPNRAAYHQCLSADGRFVGFISTATNLVTIPLRSGYSDAFVRDLELGSTTLVSLNLDGTAGGNAGSWLYPFPAFGPGARFVVFGSLASDLVATPKGNSTACDGFPCTDIFVRELQ
jgi:hypothetical protein